MPCQHIIRQSGRQWGSGEVLKFSGWKEMHSCFTSGGLIYSSSSEIQSSGGNPDETRLGHSLWGLGFKHHKLSRPKTSIDEFTVELLAHGTKYPAVLHWGHVFSYSRVFARKWELVSLKCDSQMALDCSDCNTRWLAEVHLRQRTVMCI